MENLSERIPSTENPPKRNVCIIFHDTQTEHDSFTLMDIHELEQSVNITQ